MATSQPFTMNDVDAARQFIASRTIHYRMGDTSPEARSAAFNINPIAAVRSANLIAAGEAATGASAIITEAWRSDATQAVYRANREGRPVTYNGVTYRPDTYVTESGKTVQRRTSYPTARPGGSNHREGGALDFSEQGDAGKVRNWMRSHAGEFGMRVLRGDAPHIEVAEAAPLNEDEAGFVVREMGYASVEDFQAKNGLGVDGVVGPQTTKAMLAAVSQPSVQAAADPASKPFTVYSSDIYKAEKEGKLAAVPPMSVQKAGSHVYAGDPFGVAGSKGAATASKGDPAVANLQTYLAQNGFDPGPVTGVMSDQTMTALNGYNAKVDPEGDTMARVMLAEARGEGPEGMAAVAWVARNRTLDQSGLWPKDIAGVVSQKDQFAAPLDKADPAAYAEAFKIATQVRSAPPEQDPTQGATYFKTGAVNPRWASTEPFKGKVGNHEFYGQVQTEAPTPQMAYADAVDRMDTEAPAQQAIDDMLTGQSSEQVLAGGPRMDPRRAGPTPGPIAPDGGSFARTVADVLDEGPNLRPDLPARFRPGPGGAVGQDLGTMPAGMPLPPDRPGGAPDASLVPNPPAMPGGAPDASAVPIPPSRASGLPDPTIRPDINDPSLSFNRQSGRGPDMREALADQLDTMVAGRPEYPGSLPAADPVLADARTKDDVYTPSAEPQFMSSEERGRLQSPAVREMFPDVYPESAPETPSIGNLNYADVPPVRIPQTQAAVMEPGSGAGPYGPGMPALLAFDQRRMDEGLKAPITLPETYAQLLDMPDMSAGAWPGANANTWKNYLAPGVVPGELPETLSLDAMPGSDTARFFNANQPSTATVDRVMSILNEGREPTVSLAGGPRQTSADWSQPGSGQWMTDAPGGEIIGRGQGWWEPTPEPEYAGIPQGDSDWSPTNTNAGTIEPTPAAQITADALDAADAGMAGGQPLIGSYAAMGTTPPVIDINQYHPDAMVLNAPGALVAGRPVGTGGAIQITQQSAPLVAAPPVSGGNGGGGLFNGGGFFGGLGNIFGAEPEITWNQSGQGQYGVDGSTNWQRGTSNALGGSNVLSWTGSNGQPVTVTQDPWTNTYYGPA